MRLAFLLPVSLLFAAPVAAQSGYGPLVDGPVIAGPVNGWGADAGYFGRNQYTPRKLVVAHRLVAAGRYAEADPLLNELIGRSGNRHIRFLKGVTALGLGDPATARRFFERSMPGGGRVGAPGAMSGLALAEIRLGNAGAARHILSDLRYQQEKCRSDCDRADALEQAVAVVERELT